MLSLGYRSLRQPITREETSSILSHDEGFSLYQVVLYIKERPLLNRSLFNFIRCGAASYARYYNICTHWDDLRRERVRAGGRAGITVEEQKRDRADWEQGTMTRANLGIPRTAGHWVSPVSCLGHVPSVREKQEEGGCTAMQVTDRFLQPETKQNYWEEINFSTLYIESR